MESGDVLDEPDEQPEQLDMAMPNGSTTTHALPSHALPSSPEVKFSAEALREEKLFTAAADAFSDACRRKRTLLADGAQG